MSVFRGNTTESIGSVEPVNTGFTPKSNYICQCGAIRFKWIATEGVIKAGGFIPDSYEYECLGCGRKHTQEMIQKYFAR